MRKMCSHLHSQDKVFAGKLQERDTGHQGKTRKLIGLAKHWYRATREVTTSVQGIFKALETAKRLAVTYK